MSAAHARRYSRIREWRTARAAANYTAKHRRTTQIERIHSTLRVIARNLGAA